MNISKPVKILIGALTLFIMAYPFLLMPLYFAFIFKFGFLTSYHYGFPDERALEALVPIMMIFYPVMMCATFIQLGMQIFYIIHEIKNKALTDTFRILFAIGTFFMPVIAMPIYFIAYLWKDSSGQISQPVVASQPAP